MGIRFHSFEDWLSDLFNHPVFRWLGRVLAVLVLAGVGLGLYRVVQDHQAEQAATNARLERAK